MNEFAPVYSDLWKKTEWVAIATSGNDGPHVVGAWGEHLRALNGDLSRTILVPVGGYRTTEENLKQDSKVELLLASRQVESSHSLGQGCSFIGTAEVQTSGPELDRVKQIFDWARGALVIRIEDAKLHL